MTWPPWPICPPSRRQHPFPPLLRRLPHLARDPEDRRLTRKSSRIWSTRSPEAFRDSALNPELLTVRGPAQNGDVYFQRRESRNNYYNAVPDIVARYMGEISEMTGRDYRCSTTTAPRTPSTSSSPWAPSATWPRRSSTT